MRLRIIALVVLCLCLLFSAKAQQTRSLVPSIRSVQLLVGGKPAVSPVVNLGNEKCLTLEFDELSHDFHRYGCEIEHCNASWESSGLLQSEAFHMISEPRIEDSQESVNTNNLYTHYTFSFPNEDVRWKLSGNYRLRVIDLDEDVESPVIEACLSVVDSRVNVGVEVSSNTDVDMNRSHQQVNVYVNHPSYDITYPESELIVKVVQNRHYATPIVATRPTYILNNQLQYVHNRDFIFNGENEYRKFEFLSRRSASMGVNTIRYVDGNYHVFLFEDTPLKNHIDDESQNGICLYRTTDADDVNTEGEYAYVCFSFKSPRLPGDVYIDGELTAYTEDCLAKPMVYDEIEGAYVQTLFLKQGYYNYRYVTRDSSVHPEGNFYETSNLYEVFVYHRPQGSRYDRLIGYNSTVFSVTR